MGLLDILKQYSDPAGVEPDRVGGHFDEVAQQSNPHDLGNGVAAAFRSDATPPFGQMVGDLFGRSDPQQRAGILNQILASVGAGRAWRRSRGGVLGRVLGGAGAPASAAPTITPAQASQISPADAAVIAAHAEQQDGSIVDKAGEFYAQHPALVKWLGAAALAIASAGCTAASAERSRALRAGSGGAQQADVLGAAFRQPDLARAAEDLAHSGALVGVGSASNVSLRGIEAEDRVAAPVAQPDHVAIVDVDRVRASASRPAGARCARSPWPDRASRRCRSAIR